MCFDGRYFIPLEEIKVKRNISNFRGLSGSDYLFFTFEPDDRDRLPEELRADEREMDLLPPEKLLEEDILPLEPEERLEDDVTRE